MIDGDGAFAHYFYSEHLGDEPAFDMEVFDAIRLTIVRLRNEDMRNV